MTKKIGSSLASWKSAALLVLVAMIASVAFSGVLTTTNTASAAVTDSEGDPIAEAVTAGTTVYIETEVAEGDTVLYTISDNSTASGRFTAVTATSGGQALLCKQGSAACDSEEETADDTTVRVAVKIDATSKSGLLIVEQDILRVGAVDGVDVIEVEGVTAPSQINISASVTSISFTEIDAPLPGAANVAILTIEVLNSKRVGLPNQLVTVQTTNGLLNDIGSVAADGTATGVDYSAGPPPTGGYRAGSAVATVCSDSLGCRVTTRSAQDAVTTGGDSDSAVDAAGEFRAVAVGTAQLLLSGGGRSGVATVTVSQGNLSDSVEIVLHAGAKNISVAADESSIQSGGSTFLVATVTDAGDQPVADAVVAVAGAPDAPQGPEEDSVPVSYDTSVSRPNPPSPAPIPACSAGTDNKGKCAVKVYAVKQGVDPDGAGEDGGSLSAAKATTDRGTHTVTLETDIAGGKAKASASFEVSGAPSAIATDAPARVDALKPTVITVTVTDDAGELAGAAAIRVDQIEGAGKVTDGPKADGTTMTRDGSAKFTFLAPGSTGEAVFLIRIGVAPGPVIQETVTIAIGPEPEEAPEAPPATWNNALVSGQNLVVWNGPDGADPSEGDAEGVTAIWWYNNGAERWDGYFPDAAGVPGGNTLGSLSNGQAYVVIVN